MPNPRAAIVCIVKDEQRYLPEWIAHHLNAGFRKIFVYEDIDSGSHARQLQPFGASVELHSIASCPPAYDILQQQLRSRGTKTTRTQLTLYRWCCEKLKEEGYDWVAPWDPDEFLFFQEGWTLQRLLDTFSPYPGVYLGWRLMNANGHIQRPQGSVVRNFTTAVPDRWNRHWCVKSLVNLHRYQGLDDVHVATGAVNTQFLQQRETPVYDKAWLNHYFTRSWEEWVERTFKRGNLQPDFRTVENFFAYNPELAHLREQLLAPLAEQLPATSMWLDRSRRIIAGGNTQRIRRLNTLLSQPFPAKPQ